MGLRLGCCLLVALALGCSQSTTRPDAGSADAATRDASSRDSGAIDSGPRRDAGALDAAARSDAGLDCDPQEAAGLGCGPADDPAIVFLFDGTSCVEDAFCGCVGADCDAIFDSRADCERTYAPCLREGGCGVDAHCERGAEWCEAGACEACSNAGLLCDIFCANGWSTYERNGCFPCECAPPNECVSDEECGAERRCYPGAFCWCGDGEARPDCCQGNQCSNAGCVAASPEGCLSRGCPRGTTCQTATGCASSGCDCAGSGWACDSDCGGGVCLGTSITP